MRIAKPEACTEEKAVMFVRREPLFGVFCPQCSRKQGYNDKNFNHFHRQLTTRYAERKGQNIIGLMRIDSMPN